MRPGARQLVRLLVAVSSAALVWQLQAQPELWLAHLTPWFGRQVTPFTPHYLILNWAGEGMSVWLHTLMETLHLAREFNLTFVEPCIRGGRVIPCRPGRVTAGIPESWSPDLLINATHDPLRLPAYAEDCTPLALNSSAAPLSDGWAHPLRLYVSLPALRAIYPNIISYDEWARLQLPADAAGATRIDSAIVGRGGGLYTSPMSLCIGGSTKYCTRNWLSKNASIQHSNYSTVPRAPYGTAYKKLWPAPPPQLSGLLRDAYAAALLRGDELGSRTVFLAGAGRGFAFHYGAFPTPKFNDIHLHAVASWLRVLNAESTEAAFSNSTGNTTSSPARTPPATPSLGFPSSVALFPKYSALQWRSETVEGTRISRCATKIASEAAKVWRVEKGGSPIRLRILLADIPAPNSRCAVWSVYRVKAGGNPRFAAVQLLMQGSPGTGPMHKYDAHALGVDAGVLSVRDVLLAVKSDSLLGCTTGGRTYHSKKGKRSGGSCRDCYRFRSNYFRWILELRGNQKPSYNVY